MTDTAFTEGAKHEPPASKHAQARVDGVCHVEFGGLTSINDPSPLRMDGDNLNLNLNLNIITISDSTLIEYLLLKGRISPRGRGKRLPGINPMTWNNPRQ